MNRDEIIRMAREAGFESHDISLNFPKELARFAAIAAAAERDACAKVCEKRYETHRDLSIASCEAGMCAHLIRARGQA